MKRFEKKSGPVAAGEEKYVGGRESKQLEAHSPAAQIPLIVLQEFHNCLTAFTFSNYPSLQGCTVLGTPERVESVGETEVPHSLFLDYVIALGDSTFGPAKFDRRSHNSNAFCKEVTQFLCGKQYPLGVDEKEVKENIQTVIVSFCTRVEVTSRENGQVPPDDLLSTEVSRLLDSESLISSESVGISFGDRKLSERFLESTTETNAEFRRGAREASPEFEELQRQIEALRYAEESRGRGQRARQNAINLRHRVLNEAQMC